MLTEKTVIEMERDQEELVRRREIVNIYRDGELLMATVVDNRLIKPGDDVSSESKVVRRMCNALFIPTVVDREKARQAHEAAMEELAKDDTTKTRKVVVEAKTKLDIARQAYDDFESS